MKMIMAAATFLSIVFGCSESDPPSPTAAPIDSQVIDTSLFNEKALNSTPRIVDCVMQDGSTTRCTEIVVGHIPDGLNVGPFCPTTLDYEGGIWDWDGESPGLYRLNRQFFEFLATLGFQFADDDGKINIADPNAGPPGNGNSCLEASPDTSVTITLLIPLAPSIADQPTSIGTVSAVGIGVDGVPIFGDAPSVLQTGGLPALDNCGGHWDPGGWFHWHATATDVEASFAYSGVSADCNLEQSSSDLFGYAFDGFPMYGHTDSGGTMPQDLDSCGGHTGITHDYPDGVYHYHAPLDFPNLPPCLVGKLAQDLIMTTAASGVGSGGRPPGGPPPGGSPPQGE